jgi:hypothetical protein
LQRQIRNLRRIVTELHGRQRRAPRKGASR